MIMDNFVYNCIQQEMEKCRYFSPFEFRRECNVTKMYVYMHIYVYRYTYSERKKQEREKCFNQKFHEKSTQSTSNHHRMVGPWYKSRNLISSDSSVHYEKFMRKPSSRSTSIKIIIIVIKKGSQSTIQNKTNKKIEHFKIFRKDFSHSFISSPLFSLTPFLLSKTGKSFSSFFVCNFIQKKKVAKNSRGIKMCFSTIIVFKLINIH